MDIIEIDCLEAQARERTVKAVHQAARRASARKGKEFRGYHHAGGTGAAAATHDALREVDFSCVDHARAGIMNGPVCFQHGPAIGTPPLVRADAQGQHIDAGSPQGARIMARIMICGHRWTSHKAKAPLAGWRDDASASRLRNSDYGRIIFWHAHMIVPGGGISLEDQRWISCRPGFFLPVRVLSRLFRRLFLEKLVAAHLAGRLSFFGDHARLADAQSFAAYLAPLRKAEWVVYSKRPFGGPQAVLAYLSRYTHRVAIANSRLITFDKQGVTFKW